MQATPLQSIDQDRSSEKTVPLDANIRVWVVDRNRMSSQLLADSLARDHRFEAIVVRPQDVSSLAATRAAHLIVISADLDSGPGQGLELARRVSGEHPPMGILILLDKAHRESVIEAFRSGAKGVFCRTDAVDDFLQCVERVSRGEIWAGKSESDCLLEAFRSVPSPRLGDNAGINGLTNRELQVVQYAAQGYTNKSIAEELGLSEHTVKNYLFRAFEKLKVSSRIELLFYLTVKGQNIPNGERHKMLGDQPLSVQRRDASAGSPLAQLRVGLAHRDGAGVEKDLKSAYFWFKVAECTSLELGNQSRALVEEIKLRLSSEQIRDLDHKAAASARRHLPVEAKSPSARASDQAGGTKLAVVG